jgi:hypothetical protein
MNQIKGKFITLTAGLMSLYKDRLKEADAYLFSKTGKHWDELDPEGWYELEIYNRFLAIYSEASFAGERAMVTLGKSIYPAIKKRGGMPADLKTPISYIDFEARGFITNLRGPDIKPRKFVQKEEGSVIVQMDGRVRNCLVSEGVYQSILEMSGANDGHVEHKKCVKRGDETCEFHITWKWR